MAAGKEGGGAPRPVRLAEYTPPAFLVDEIDLRVDLFESEALVASRLVLRRNPARSEAGLPLELYGRHLELTRISVNGVPLAADAYRIEGERLLLAAVPAGPEPFELTVNTRIKPAANTALEVLYRSGGMFCTQCEPEGFRRITWFPDRPDVLARYTTTITADRVKCPVLLANGNRREVGELPDGRHYAVWHDPFPKPSYLFALVAGDLARISDSFTTASGRPVGLEIYVEAANRDKCGHAMQALKKAMRWDEETFGLEYDLDLYMIVAVDDFNMGAMENKGLNIFNSKYVLARPESATDDDFEAIEAVIAHEYFHNWTGNRVTCRDWFQLSLKEGLTVFRDQLFSADAVSPGVKRISDVRLLRERQFPEDGGPLAHPVRPDSYIEINNFYTVTVYEKGAELIRMLYLMLGPARFRAGLRLYLSRHDGAAATVEDFLAAIGEAGEVDLGRFKRWYEQAGTPEVTVALQYEPAAAEVTLTMRQSCPATPDQPGKEPFHISIALGFLDHEGREVEWQAAAGHGKMLHLKEAEASFKLRLARPLPQAPLPSLLRGFSAPVKLHYQYRDSELARLLAHDQDSFNRWEAGQELACRLLLGVVAQGRPEAAGELAADHGLVVAWRHLLAGDELLVDPAFSACLLTLPGEEYLAEKSPEIDVEAIHVAREGLRRALARHFRPVWEKLYQQCRAESPYRHDRLEAGKRRLRNLALYYLLALDEPELRALARRHFCAADNMTDRLAALRLLVHAAAPEAAELLAVFAEQWRDEPLVMDKWLAVQATAPGPAALARVRELMNHPAFRLSNPNRVRALIGAFAAANPTGFHAADGSSYRFLADQVLALDPVNPQIAARMAANLSRRERHQPRQRALMEAELGRLARAAAISRDLYEVVSKSLAAKP